MAHDIETHGDKATFITSKKAAWHQLGTTLPDAFTAEQAMEQGYLGGWNVRKSPTWTTGADGSPLVVPEKHAVVRNNPFEPGKEDVLGVVGDTYKIVQNEEHADFLNALVDESGAHFDSAGSLNGGRVVFITMKMPGHITIGGVDPVENYLAAFNSHDGSMAFTTMVTPVRVVCANTMNAAFGNNSHVFRVRHTSGIRKGLVGQARQVLDMSFRYIDGFQEQAEQLINTEVTQARFEDIVRELVGPGKDAHPRTVTRSENKMEEIIELFADGMTHANLRNTAYAGLNAFIEWTDHYAPTRGDDRDNARAQKAILTPGFKDVALSRMLAEANILA